MTQQEQFIELANYRMPFGKYKGQRLLDLPEAYYVWFLNKGLPPGKLGKMMKSAYEIRINGLEYLFDKARINKNT
jgi:uncharacterized protein (DUF3820 family)